MKKEASVYLKILIICACLFLVLASVFGVSVGVTTKPVQEIEENVPYISDEAPSFFGLLMRFEGAQSVYFAFDKQSRKTTVIMLPNNADSSSVLEYGYYVDCVSHADFDFLARFIDNFGGIELNTDSGLFKYTGVQITEMLKKTNDIHFKKTVINRVINNISEKTLERADLLMLIEGTDTDLNFPSAYYLHDTINSALSTVSFVN